MTQTKPFASDWMPISAVISDFRISPRDLFALISEKEMESNGVDYDDFRPELCTN